MDEEDEDIPPVLHPCPICNRTFRPDALARHEKICKKTAEKKRKVFNSSKQRAEGSEITPTSTTAVVKPVKKPNWRDKHNEFINNIRAAKGKDVQTTGESTEPKKNIPSGYIQCPTCERHFNQKAAERHINWCKSQNAHVAKRSTPNEAKERLQARTKYKAPTPGKKGKEEVQSRKSGNPTEKVRVKTSVERSPPESNDIGKKSGRMDTATSSVKSGKPSTAKTIYERDVIRSRESVGSQGSGSQSSQHQVVKFKDKFPNRSSKRSPDLEDSFSTFSNSSSHFRDVLQTKSSDNHSPRTVPGVRTGGMDTNMNLSQSMNSDVTNEEYNLLQRLVDLNGSFQGNAGPYDLNSSWNKKMFPSNHNLPEVSSCDEPTQAWPSRSCWGSSGNTPMSSGSSISSLSTNTSGSRGGSSESIMPLFCCYCGSKYPVSAAKYCCECGAKRKGFGAMNLKTELVGY